MDWGTLPTFEDYEDLELDRFKMEKEDISPTVDMRGDGDQLRPCNAAGCYSKQQQCNCFKKARWLDKCDHLRMEEFCLR